MIMTTEMLDMCVLGEIFSVYSEDRLKQWGLPGFQTTAVQINAMKRVFKMERKFIEGVKKGCFIFSSPEKEAASCLSPNFPLFTGDKLFITYTVTAYGDDNGLVRIPLPGGVYLKANLYAVAA